MSSPTQRSLKRLKDAGAFAAVVERYNSFIRRRQDLFGFIDIVALDAGAGVLGVQTTSSSNLSSRVRKVVDDPMLSEIAKAWLGRGNRLEFHGWVKRGRFWRCRVIDLCLYLDVEDGPRLQIVERPDESGEVATSRRKITKPDRSSRTTTAPADALPTEKPLTG